MNKREGLTAVEEVLLAAAELSNKSKEEFSEWELTVKAWLLNKNRWGLRGFEEKYPDHKRVMNEIMSSGTQKIVGRGWVEKVRPNYYKLTSAGLAMASSISESSINPKIRSLHEYEAIYPYAYHKVFENHLRNMDEPKTWIGAESFLGLQKHDADTLNRKLRSIKESILSSLRWLRDNGVEVLVKNDSSKPISRDRLNKLNEFLDILEERFKPQFDAMRKKK